MSALRVSAIVLLAAGLAGWIVAVWYLADQPLEEVGGAGGELGGSDQAIALRPFRFRSNEECEPCHREIFDEWFEDQHSKAWFNQPLLVQDPKLTECNCCHAPRPVLETGIEALAVIRTDLFHEGVGCIACHVNVDHVEGPRPSSDAACNPRENPTFTQSRICASCHAPHGSLDEWKQSEWATKGYTCQSCHMPLVDAPVVTDGPPRRRRSHRMRSQRDPEFLRGALELHVAIASGKVDVRIANTGAGHNVPGEIYNRELFLLTTVFDSDGVERFEQRESFKTVRRAQRASETSTQLRSGETRRFEYDLPIEHGRVRVRVGYKFLVLHSDNLAVPVFEREAEF